MDEVEVELGAAAGVVNAGDPSDEVRLEALTRPTVFVRLDGFLPHTDLTSCISFGGRLFPVL